jgi:integrase
VTGPRKALTDTGVRAMKPRAERYEIFEGDGFGIRVGTSGKKSWVLLFRPPAAPGCSQAAPGRRFVFGSYPELGLKEARNLAGEHRAALRRGENPALTRRVERRQRAEALTVEQLVFEYMEKHAKRMKKSWAQDQQYLDRHIVPAWGDMLAEDVTRSMVIAMLDGISSATPTTANRVLAVTRKMFNFAVGRDLVQHSPCFQVAAPRKESRRDRVLVWPEIRALWRGLATFRPAGEPYDAAKWTPISEGTALALKFQLTTAQRIGEIAGMPWAEVDFASGWWTIGGARSKNGLPHRVPLSKLALALLERARDIGNGSAYVFPTREQEGRQDAAMKHGVVDYGLRRCRPHLGLDHFTAHDLRRSAASLMTGAGIPRLVVGKILNHAEGGVTAVYDRHSYDAEKRAALDAWASLLTQELAKEDE